jgi:hypothetical protein
MDTRTGPKVQPSCGNGDSFSKKHFTFQIGLSRRPFIVHADDLSRHPRVVRQVIESVVREGIKRHAQLPEVAPATFEHFLAHAYFTSTNRSGDENLDCLDTIDTIDVNR